MCYVVGKIKINKCKKNIYIQVLLTFSSMGLNQYDLFDLTSLKFSKIIRTTCKK